MEDAAGVPWALRVRQMAAERGDPPAPEPNKAAPIGERLTESSAPAGDTLELRQVVTDATETALARLMPEVVGIAVRAALDAVRPLPDPVDEEEGAVTLLEETPAPAADAPELPPPGSPGDQ